MQAQSYTKRTVTLNLFNGVRDAILTSAIQQRLLQLGLSGRALVGETAAPALTREPRLFPCGRRQWQRRWRTRSSLGWPAEDLLDLL